MVKLSIIIPALNESSVIEKTLRPLQAWRAQGHEIIVVDGGSQDDTLARAAPYTDHILSSPPGRALQMNQGAAMATGDILLFLHADTLLPANAFDAIAASLDEGAYLWGRFDVRLSGQHPMLRVVEMLMNIRSCLTAIATGDQAIFIKREVFEQIHGFPSIEIMEDVALSKRLKRLGRPACLRPPLQTSSRRWEQQGIYRTIWLMWHMRLAYFMGVSPKRLAKRYRSSAKHG